MLVLLFFIPLTGNICVYIEIILVIQYYRLTKLKKILHVHTENVL